MKPLKNLVIAEGPCVFTISTAGQTDDDDDDWWAGSVNISQNWVSQPSFLVIFLFGGSYCERFLLWTAWSKQTLFFCLPFCHGDVGG